MGFVMCEQGSIGLPDGETNVQTETETIQTEDDDAAMAFAARLEREVSGGLGRYVRQGLEMGASLESMKDSIRRAMAFIDSERDPA